MDLEKNTTQPANLGTFVSNEAYNKVVMELAEAQKNFASEVEKHSTRASTAWNELLKFKVQAAEALSEYENLSGYALQDVFDRLDLERPMKTVEVEMWVKVKVSVTTDFARSPESLEEELRISNSGGSVQIGFENVEEYEIAGAELTRFETVEDL